ncbi:isochorismate synthase [Falsarthrobacter nasiphocae]|uniref:Menaquinone-specific isochorismate synthase n=1 Tax=Falsarthrobacter nasiphocae TaxID=189863 RepID=A0AAE4C6C4_9MICC|nr:chorismate-binding protein [Falsarthrobacter nasiphocae]MDR6892433.1 menaquinone-specific isochorismate synthase [Falsarthrobacter nasiphocae]
MAPPLSSLTVPLSAGTAEELGLTAGTLGPLTAVAGALAWIREGRGFVGLGETARFTATGPGRFADLQAQFRAATGGAGQAPGLAGSGAFAFAKITYSKRSPVASELIVPRVVVGHPEASFSRTHGESVRPWLTILSTDPSEELTPELAHAEAVRLAALREPDRERSAADAVTPGALGEDEWVAAVATGVSTINQREVTKIVMARDVVVRTESPISRSELTRRLARAYDSCWTYSVDGLIGATPEMLIRVIDGHVQARVLAGTIDRQARPDATIDDARAEFLGSAKQVHEHRLAIESLVSELAPFAPELVHDSEPFVLELPNVWHLASDVSVKVGDDGRAPSALDLAEAVHPTAAVCGTPRLVASLIIRELERMDRGHYAGPVGWVDAAGNGEFGIALRGTVLDSPVSARVFGGCGIVAGSDPESELLESWAKMRPVLDAFGLERPSTRI